jgi:DUF4097 and DUF4098 domain-containing protein YvlB
MKMTLLMLALATSTALAATEEQSNKTFQVSPGGTLVVDVDFGSIEVSSNSTDTVAVSVWRKVSRKNADEEEKFLSENPVVFVQEGSTVTVRCRQKDKDKFHWFGGWANKNEGKYTIQVPARFSLQLDTSGGGIIARDVTGEAKAHTSGGGLQFSRLHGPLNGDTSGGGIQVADCEGPIKIHTSGGGIETAGGGGSLDGNTSGGPITVKDFNGPVDIHTSGGGITVENVGGSIDGHTSGGSIHALLLSPMAGEVKLSTSGGGVTAKIPATAAFDLEAETSGGSVSCDLPVTVQGKIHNNRINGPVNGGGPLLRLKSSGGGIHVEKI